MNTSTTPRSSRRARLAAVLAVTTAFAILGVVAALAIPAGGAASAATPAATPAGTAATQKASTSASITPALGVYFGQVKSESRSCESGRTVELLHVEQGDDRLVDSAKETGRSGDWSVDADPNMTGSFYVQVAKNDKCDAVSSGVVQSIAIPVMD